MTIGSISALALAQSLLPRYAEAQTNSFTDRRVKARYVDYLSPGGTSGEIRGYLMQSAGNGPFPGLLVIHENRDLNPHTENVARRAAVEGFFLALATDGLAPVDGYPGNDDDRRTLQRGLDQAKLRQNMVNSARYLKAYTLSTDKIGATGFCRGGGTMNFLALSLGGDLNVSMLFYGAAPSTNDVTKVRAPLPVHYAKNDESINAMRPSYEAVLRANNLSHEMHTYPSTRHGFPNNSTSHYDEAAANLTWEHTITFFKQHFG